MRSTKARPPINRRELPKKITHAPVASLQNRIPRPLENKPPAPLHRAPFVLQPPEKWKKRTAKLSQPNKENNQKAHPKSSIRNPSLERVGNENVKWTDDTWRAGDASRKPHGKKNSPWGCRPSKTSNEAWVRQVHNWATWNKWEGPACGKQTVYAVKGPQRTRPAKNKTPSSAHANKGENTKKALVLLGFWRYNFNWQTIPN